MFTTKKKYYNFKHLIVILEKLKHLQHFERETQIILKICMKYRICLATRKALYIIKRN